MEPIGYRIVNTEVYMYSVYCIFPQENYPHLENGQIFSFNITECTRYIRPIWTTDTSVQQRLL
jgi:hypothetical protein